MTQNISNTSASQILKEPSQHLRRCEFLSFCKIMAVVLGVLLIVVTAILYSTHANKVSIYATLTCGGGLIFAAALTKLLEAYLGINMITIETVYE